MSLETEIEDQDNYNNAPPSTSKVPSTNQNNNNNQSSSMDLLPSNYFETSASRLQNVVETAMKRVNNGSSSEQEIVTVKQFYQNDFEMVQTKMNEISNTKSNEMHDNYQRIFQDIIETGDEKVRRLNHQLNELVETSPALKGKLKFFEDQIHESELKVKKAKNHTIDCHVSLVNNRSDFERINDFEINSNLSFINKKIDDLSEKIQSQHEDATRAFEQLKTIHEMGLHNVISNLMVRFDHNLERMESQYREREERLNEAYEEHEKILNSMIEELTQMNSELEKKRQLDKEVHHIHLANPSDDTLRIFITVNVNEIKSINDLSTRRSKVEALYKRFCPFTGLLGREDLGVKAKASDLEAVKLWLDRTKIDVVLCHFGEFSILSEDDIHKAFNGKHFRIVPGGQYSHGNLFGKSFHYQPNGIENFFEGAEISRPLMERRKQLENKIKSIEGADRNVVLSQLKEIFKKNDADNSVSVRWTHPFRPGGVCHGRPFDAHEVSYHKNGKRLGHCFQETIVDWWGESSGIFGHCPYQKKKKRVVFE